MSETTAASPELSNRRFYYETLVTGLRRHATLAGDGTHRLDSYTDTTGNYTADDYLFFQHADGFQGGRFANEELTTAILDARRPIINVNVTQPDDAGWTHNYVLLYPDDLDDASGLVGRPVEQLLPYDEVDWPDNEVFIYDLQAKPGEPSRYAAVPEPFTDPRLNAIYNDVVTM